MPPGYIYPTLLTEPKIKKILGEGGMVAPWRNTLDKSKQKADYGYTYTTCGLLIHEIFKSHNDATQSAELLCTSDLLFAETFKR